MNLERAVRDPLAGRSTARHTYGKEWH